MTLFFSLSNKGIQKLKNFRKWKNAFLSIIAHKALKTSEEEPTLRSMSVFITQILRWFMMCFPRGVPMNYASGNACRRRRRNDWRIDRETLLTLGSYNYYRILSIPSVDVVYVCVCVRAHASFCGFQRTDGRIEFGDFTGVPLLRQYWRAVEERILVQCASSTLEPSVRWILFEYESAGLNFGDIIIERCVTNWSVSSVIARRPNGNLHSRRAVRTGK